ncbi:MAG: hypothetical protein HOC38_06240 [Nitrosopumilus sp.]|nr:hypothetical protein [Nitrosopumilus sp.]
MANLTLKSEILNNVLENKSITRQEIIEIYQNSTKNSNDLFLTAKNLRDAVEILKEKKVDFKFDGEMQPDVALDENFKELYPFSEIVGNANVLIMPGRHSAAISFKLMKSLSAVKVVGPLLVGLGQPIEIAPLRSSTSEILNLASVAAYSSDIIDYTNKKKN